MANNNQDTTVEKTNEKSRRDFLKTAGKFAIYTPPALMILMNPDRAALACSPKPNGKQGHGFFRPPKPNGKKGPWFFGPPKPKKKFWP